MAYMVVLRFQCLNSLENVEAFHTTYFGVNFYALKFFVRAKYTRINEILDINYEISVLIFCNMLTWRFSTYDMIQFNVFESLFNY